MKKIFTFFAAMLMSASLFAQWVKPVPQFEEMKDDGTEVQYLYNVEFGGFLVGANDWGTRASLSTTEGWQVKMEKLYEDAEKTTPSGYWAIRDSVLAGNKKGKWSEVDCGGYNDIWIDGDGRNGASKWIVTALGDNKYEITNGFVNTGKFGWAPYISPETTDPENPIYDSKNTRLWILDYTLEADLGMAFSKDLVCGSTWAFVSLEEFEAWKDKGAIYAAAMDLKEQIEWAESKGITESALADEIAVYNNTNSTIEELNNAAASAYDKGRYTEIAQYFDNIIQGEKNDVSGVFTNNDFESGNVNGWDITWQKNTDAATNIGKDPNGTEYKNGDVVVHNFIEAWKSTAAPAYLGDGSITQTIPGLPAGKYMLAVDVIASNQGRISDPENPNNIPDDVQLFAKASLDGKEYYTQMGTKDGIPEHFEFVFVHTGGSMQLGLRVTGSAEAKMPANWIAMDNLKLYYYGEVKDDPDKILLDTEIARVVALIDPENMEEVVAGDPEKAAYADEIKAAKAATENFIEEKDKVTAAYNALVASIEAYDNLLNVAIPRWENKVASMELSAPEWDSFCEFVQMEDPVEGYPTPSVMAIKEGDRSLTTAEVKAYIEAVDELYRKAFLAGLTEGTDCTDMLTNASFKDGFTGWENVGGSAGTLGGLKDFPCVEVYNGTIHRHQVVEGAPDGIYSLKCYAFERPWNNAEGVPTISYIFMNDFKTPVQNIRDGGITAEECVDETVEGGPIKNNFREGGDPKEPFYSTGGTTNADSQFDRDGVTYYVPNGMSGASYAFRAGRYEQTVYGLVEGGKMDIGISTGGVNTEWVLWSNFVLTYEGKSAAALESILPIYIKQLDDYIKANTANMNGLGLTAAEDAVSAAETALNSGDGEKMYQALIDVNAALEAAKANVAIVAELTTTTTKLTDAITDNEDTARKDALDNAAALVAESDDVDSMTDEQMKDLIARMEDAIAALKIPADVDFTKASDEEPLEVTEYFVDNPSFETGDLTGWTAYIGGDTGAKENSNGTYTINGADGSYVFNTWSGSAPAEGFWLSQTVKHLPAGGYTIYAIFASDANNKITLDVNGESTEFTMEGDKATANNASQQFAIAEGDEAVIKVSSPSWFKADNFKLFYHGANSSICVGINEVSTSKNAKAGIYTLSGARVTSLQKGINIIRMSDGSVHKVLVK